MEPGRGQRPGPRPAGQGRDPYGGRGHLGDGAELRIAAFSTGQSEQRRQAGQPAGGVCVALPFPAETGEVNCVAAALAGGAEARPVLPAPGLQVHLGLG